MSFFGDLTETKKDFGPIPEGKYVAEVTDASVDEKGLYWVEGIKTEGPVATIEFTLTSGDYARRKVWMNYPLNVQAKVKSLGTQLSRLGLDVDSAESVQDVASLLVEKLQGQTVNVGVTTWLNERTNKVKNFAYINEPDGDTAQVNTVKNTFDSNEEIPF